MNLIGGSVNGHLSVSDNGKVTILDGMVSSGCSAVWAGELIISGGSVVNGGLNTTWGGKATILNGIVNGGCVVSMYSDLIISGGSLSGSLSLWDQTNITISGGSVSGDLKCGGEFYGYPSIDWSGGTIEGRLLLGRPFVLRGTEINRFTIYGSNFAIDGKPIDGTILQLTDYTMFNGMQHLTGILANGDIIDNIFTPEPASLLLLGLGGLLIKKR